MGRIGLISDAGLRGHKLLRNDAPADFVLLIAPRRTYIRLAMTDADDEDPPIPPERRPRIRRFARKVFLVGCVLHAYVGARLLPDMPMDAVGLAIGGALLAVSVVLIPVGTLAHAFFHRADVIDRMVWAGGLTLGWFSSVLVLTVLRDISLVFLRSAEWAGQGAAGVIVLATLVSVIGLINARRTARVVDVDVMLERLPAALDGMTIAQITDIHIGPTIKGNFVRRVVDRVNGLGADVIAITGDIVDGKVSRLEPHVAPLAGLRARHGTYVVTGNHEYYSGADEWVEVFRGLGMRPLMNEHVMIDHDGGQLVLAGVNDYKAAAVHPDHVSDPVTAAAGSPAHAPKVLLAHQPRSALEAEQAGFDLQLSGHTHGGQFWPWNHFVRLQQPYVAGLRRHGRMQIYISRGVGYWGPPKRFAAPSEITRITLRAG